MNNTNQSSQKISATNEDIIYHKFVSTKENSVDLPRNSNHELFVLPRPSGKKIMFDITAMNEYWNSLDCDYNAQTDLCVDQAREWYEDGHLWMDRVNRFIDTVSENQAKGIVTRVRPLLSVLVDGDIHLVDGRHRYASMLASHWDLVVAGPAPCVPTYVFLEDEWKQFIVTDRRINIPLTASGS